MVDLFDSAEAAAPIPPPPSNVATVAPVPVTPIDPPVKLPPAPAGKRDIIVVIDAGHGGEDPAPRVLAVSMKKTWSWPSPVNCSARSTA